MGQERPAGCGRNRGPAAPTGGPVTTPVLPLPLARILFLAGRPDLRALLADVPIRNPGLDTV